MSTHANRPLYQPETLVLHYSPAALSWQRGRLWGSVGLWLVCGLFSLFWQTLPTLWASVIMGLCSLLVIVHWAGYMTLRHARLVLDGQGMHYRNYSITEWWSRLALPTPQWSVAWADIERISLGTPTPWWSVRQPARQSQLCIDTVYTHHCICPCAWRNPDSDEAPQLAEFIDYARTQQIKPIIFSPVMRYLAVNHILTKQAIAVHL